MATLDDLCEAFDKFEAPGDTPMRFKLDGEFLELAAVHREPDGTITVELEQDPIEDDKDTVEVLRRDVMEMERKLAERRDTARRRHEASIHWGGDGI